MFDALRGLLHKKESETEAAESKHATIQIAASVLLLEASHADDECTPTELDHIRTTLQHLFKVTDAVIEDLLELANSKREHEVDIWQFSNQINQEFDKQDKLAIIEAMWQIIYMDGKLDSHEDQFAHKLANLLRLTHKELIDAKLRVKATLEHS